MIALKLLMILVMLLIASAVMCLMMKVMIWFWINVIGAVFRGIIDLL